MAEPGSRVGDVRIPALRRDPAVGGVARGVRRADRGEADQDRDDGRADQEQVTRVGAPSLAVRPQHPGEPEAGEDVRRVQDQARDDVLVAERRQQVGQRQLDRQRLGVRRRRPEEHAQQQPGRGHGDGDPGIGEPAPGELADQRAHEPFDRAGRGDQARPRGRMRR